jgi:hypothetical protein
VDNGDHQRLVGTDEKHVIAIMPSRDCAHVAALQRVARPEFRCEFTL